MDLYHRNQARDYMELLDINEEDTKDPLVLAAIAQGHAMIAMVDAIHALTKSLSQTQT